MAEGMLAFSSPINPLLSKVLLSKVPLISKPKWTASIATNGTNENSNINRQNIQLVPGSSPHVSPRPLRKKIMTRQLFVQRMATIQDRKWTHKLSGFSCVLSSAAILACAPIMSVITGDIIHLHPPPLFVLQPLLYVWASSISLLSISGTVLAIRHRPNQIFERNIFVSSSISNILSALVAIRCTTTGGFVATAVSALIITGATSSSMLILDPNIVKTRRRRTGVSASIPTSVKRKPARKPTSAFRKRSAIYSVPLLCGLPFLTYVGLDLNALVNQTTFFNSLSDNPTLHSVVIYGDVLNGLCAGIGAFILTMKDRKVISKAREYSLIASSSLISVALSAAVYSASVNVG